MSVPTLDGLTVEPPDAPRTEDTVPGARPTTRAGRKAAAEARRASGANDKAPSRPKTPRQSASAKQVADSVAGLHGLASVGALVIGKPATAAMLGASADEAGQAWAALSVRYPAIARLFTGSSDAVLFVKLLMVYGPIITTFLGEAKVPGAGDELSGLLSAFGGMAGGVTPTPNPEPIQRQGGLDAGNPQVTRPLPDGAGAGWT